METSTTAPTAPTRRRTWIAAIAIIGVIIAGGTGYTGWWFWIADKIKAEIGAWGRAQAAQDIRVMISDTDISGFPGALHVRLTDTAMGADTGVWAVRVPVIRADIAPWNLRLVRGALEGRIAAAFALPEFSGAYEIDTDSLTFSVDTGRARQIDIEGDGIHVRRTDVPLDITVEALILSLSTLADGNGQRVFADVDTLVADGFRISTFGNTIARTQTTIDVLGDVPRFGTLQERVTAWSENGGIAEIRSLLVDHGALSLRGEGTVGLDADLQPEGAFTARVGGYNQAIDGLAGSGAMSADEARVAKAVLGLLSSRPKPGGPRVIEVPLTVQERVLSAGPIRLTRLPEIRWD